MLVSKLVEAAAANAADAEDLFVLTTTAPDELAHVESAKLEAAAAKQPAAAWAMSALQASGIFSVP